MVLFFFFSIARDFQAQFVLCIFHNIRALCTGCAFPPFMSSLLLLNSVIFFILFMNFYIQNFYKRKSAAASEKLKAQ
jgi:elongation of very long chain fatty acids protein 7